MKKIMESPIKDLNFKEVLSDKFNNDFISGVHISSGSVIRSRDTIL